jgi:hypothetical protein
MRMSSVRGSTWLVAATAIVSFVSHPVAAQTRQAKARVLVQHNPEFVDRYHEKAYLDGNFSREKLAAEYVLVPSLDLSSLDTNTLPASDQYHYVAHLYFDPVAWFARACLFAAGQEKAIKCWSHNAPPNFRYSGPAMPEERLKRMPAITVAADQCMWDLTKAISKHLKESSKRK